MDKVKIEPSSIGMSEETEHLTPFLDYLIYIGNMPSGKTKNGYWEILGKEGRGFFYLTDPLPIDNIKLEFEIPESIIIYEEDGGCIYDHNNGLAIYGGCVGSENVDDNIVNSFFEE